MERWQEAAAAAGAAGVGLLLLQRYGGCCSRAAPPGPQEFVDVQRWCSRAEKGEPPRIGVIADAEAASYPADEKADRQALEYRKKNAGEYFIVAARGDTLVGFVCGTLTTGDTLEDETMATHIPAGDHLCIHSVVTVDKFRRQGHARRLLRYYIGEMRRAGKVRKISLIAKKNLIGFYQSVGFELVGESAVVHGQDPWFDFTMVLKR